MEPEALEFLKRVSKSILIAFIWLSINAIAAVKGDNAFIVGHVRIGNVLFYIWFVLSLVLLVYFFRRVWKGHV